jgi:hypothetical protein
MAECPDALQEFESLFVVERVLTTLQVFKGHKELALNCSRFISKLSPYEEICAKLTDRDTLDLLVELVTTYGVSSDPILERVLFILANVVCTQPIAREVLTDSHDIHELIFTKVIKGHAENREMVKKGYRLLANLALESSHESVAGAAAEVISNILDDALDEND